MHFAHELALATDIMLTLPRPAQHVHRDTSEDPLPLFVATFADDTAFMIVADTALGIIAKVRALVEIVVNVFVGHGLRLNFKPSKSEVMIKIRGDGRCEAEKQLFQDGTSTLPVNTAVGVINVKLVQVYKDMGDRGYER